MGSSVGSAGGDDAMDMSCDGSVAIVAMGVERVRVAVVV